MTANRYLEGNFAPVPDEITAEDLPVTGTLPDGLDGLLVRNGPNPIQPPDPATYHWFTGDGMLHGVQISGGRATSYRNRWVRTDAACRALGEEPIPGQPEDALLGEFNMANTHVVPHAGRLLALVEVALPTEVDSRLATVGRFDFGGRLRTPMTAHPKTDPASGELHFFGYDVMGPPFLRYHVADAAGNLLRSEDITLPKPTMVHDFAITQSRVVFMDLPVVFDLELAGSRGMPFRWDPANGARVGVMGRQGHDADVVWCDIEPCYVFHVLNAYDEEGGEVVLDVCRYEHMFAADRHGVGGSSPYLERWHIDPVARKVRQERVSEIPSEFPRIDDRLAGLPHRYGYMTQLPLVDDGRSGLQKVDMRTGAVQVHALPEASHASEPVFVPGSAGSAEDEGYVLSVVYDAGRDASDLIVLDAQDFTGAPLATVALPRRVPFGFHGSWVPAGTVRQG